MIDRNVEFPNRFQLQKVQGTDDIYDIIPAPGDVIAPGDLFSKGNMLPDEIVSLLGLKMANPQVKDALNVLANVGNLHVWERVQTYSEPVPAGYTLGDEINGFLYARKMGSANKYYEMTIQYGSNIGVSDDGTVYISDVTSYTNYPGSTDMQDLLKKMAGKYFKIVKFTYPDYFTSYVDELVYIPATATITLDSNINMQTDYQVVTGTPAIPAGTTTDYLTSTNRNSYPDQSAEGGQDAYYTLDDTLSNYDLGQTAAAHVVTYSSDIDVDDDGTVTLVNSNSIITSNVESLYDVSILLGKFVTTSIDSSGSIVFIPTDATASYNQVNGWSHIFMSKYQPVTGHAAIPANITITYLGQLGGGARIEVGSYVGTETYGKSNPNTLTFGFDPQLVAIFAPSKDGNYAYKLFMLRNVLGASIFDSDGNNRGVIITWSEKSVSWYSSSSTYQMNYSGYTYNYIAIG